jgi:hypothetical protein
MSDTPETNAAEERCIKTGFKTGYVDVEFACKLEREIKDLTIRAQKAEAEARNYRRALTVVHDELLRGYDDDILLKMLEAGYRGTLFND